MRIVIAAIIIMLMSSVMSADPAPTNQPPAPSAFPKNEIANNSRELDWLLKGGNQNLYLVNFYMPGDKHEEVKKDLEKKVAGNSKYKDKTTYVEINAARTYQYREILQDIGIYSEPAKLYPYVLLVQNGEGHLFRGANIADLVLQKIESVMAGKVNFRPLS